MTEFNRNFVALGVEVTHHMPAGDGCYVKHTVIPAGVTLEMHEHTFTHKSACCKGRVRVFTGEAARDMRAGDVVVIERGQKHSVYAFEDSVWLCIHATDETDPERIDHTITGG